MTRYTLDFNGPYIYYKTIYFLYFFGFFVPLVSSVNRFVIPTASQL